MPITTIITKNASTSAHPKSRIITSPVSSRTPTNSPPSTPPLPVELPILSPCPPVSVSYVPTHPALAPEVTPASRAATSLCQSSCYLRFATQHATESVLLSMRAHIGWPNTLRWFAGNGPRRLQNLNLDYRWRCNFRLRLGRYYQSLVHHELVLAVRTLYYSIHPRLHHLPNMRYPVFFRYPVPPLPSSLFVPVRHRPNPT